MSAVAASLLTLLLLAAFDRAAALRLLMPAVLGLALVTFGALTGRVPAVGEPFLLAGMAASLAVPGLALAGVSDRWVAMVLGIAVLPGGSVGLAALPGPELLAMGLALLAGAAALQGRALRCAAAGVALSAIGSAADQALAGVVAAVIAGLIGTLPSLRLRLPRGLFALPLALCLLPVASALAAADPWLLAAFLGLLALAAPAMARP